MLDDLYNRRLLELAADIPRLGRLAAPDGSATAHSRLCGSTVTVDVSVGDDGRISDFGHSVQACALGQASSALMASHAVGMGLGEIRGLRETIRAMLKEDGPAPAAPYDGFAMLEPVRDFKARHASTLLTFDATATALDQALAARAGRKAVA